MFNRKFVSDSQIYEMYKDGYSYEEISEELELDIGIVVSAIKKVNSRKHDTDLYPVCLKYSGNVYEANEIYETLYVKNRCRDLRDLKKNVGRKRPEAFVNSLRGFSDRSLLAVIVDIVENEL